jgi:integrating conjugative element relaxase (TIGR03760 family)
MLKWLAKTIPEPATCARRCAAGGLVCATIRRTVAGDAVTPVLFAPVTATDPLPDTLFDSWILTAIHRFAALVQLLPASQSHHHSIPGGLLDHSLEVACNAIRLRQGYLLPPEAGRKNRPGRPAHGRSQWSARHCCTTTGKIAVDMEIHQLDGTRWHPWQGNLAQPYRWQYQSHGRDYHLHPAAGAMLINQLLPSPLLDWLAGYPAAFASLIYQLTGHYERAGALAELVQQADKASVARYLGGNIKTALAQKPSSFPQQLSALRSLVQNELNNPECGSDGWLTEDALWLISKTTADRVRAWLLQHGVASVPENNNRLFDELLTHQLIVANEDKAIWRCIIRSDKGWSPVEPLTLLRLTPSVIWGQDDQRPACFDGDVTPIIEAEPALNLAQPTAGDSRRPEAW